MGKTLSTKNIRICMKQLINLPTELFIKILDELDILDVKHLSRCNKLYNRKLQNIVFKVIKLAWNEIEQFLEEMEHHFDRIQKIIVYNKTGDSYGEWNINLLEKFQVVRNLKFLEIRLLKATNCLKYQDYYLNNIEVLKLSAQVESSVFSLYHIKNFEKIRLIYLKNFQIIRDLEEINVDEQEKHLQFKELYINNCNWDWPFELNFYPNLTTLELYYETTNPFILGERFRDFLSEKTKLINLVNLKIEIDDTKNNSLYLYPSLNLVNLVNLKKLETLQLINFKNLDFKKFYRLIDQLALRSLHLQLVKNNNDLVDFNSYRQILKGKIENVKIQVANV